MEIISYVSAVAPMRRNDDGDGDYDDPERQRRRRRQRFLPIGITCTVTIWQHKFLLWSLLVWSRDKSSDDARSMLNCSHCDQE